MLLLLVQFLFKCQNESEVKAVEENRQAGRRGTNWMAKSQKVTFSYAFRYASVYMAARVWISVCMCVNGWTGACVWIWVCMSECMHPYMHLKLCVNECMCVNASDLQRMCTNLCKWLHACECICMNLNMYVNVCMWLCICVNSHLCM